MVIIVPSYNNSLWLKKNLDSIFSQNYKNYRVIYVNDCSTDDTEHQVEQHIERHKAQNKITVIHNKKNVGALANIYNIIHTCCEDNEIIVLVDGDDWLAHKDVLTKINTTYINSNIWLTYGQFQLFPSNEMGWCKKIPTRIINNNNFRQYKWVTSHVRTFYAWLFKKIEKKDLMYEEKFYDVAGDLALMFPMLEMAGSNIKFIPNILYQYNIDNPISDFKIKHEKQLFLEKYIRAQQKYSPLNNS